MHEQGESGRTAPREYSQDASEGPRKRSVAHERLTVFCGKWTATGSLGGGAAKPNEGRTTTEDEYKWLEGQFFLHHRGVMHLKISRWRARRSSDSMPRLAAIDSISSTTLVTRASTKAR
jgi:hypothetical protein